MFLNPLVVRSHELQEVETFHGSLYLLPGCLQERGLGGEVTEIYSDFETALTVALG